jgi:SAM-dependent methyltransferase
LEFLDLGVAPPSNAYLTAEQVQAPEVWLPLRLMVCQSCWLVQTLDYARSDALFTGDYAYFSSFSSSWLDHSRKYATEMIARFGLDANSSVCEVAANDGYLLQYFKADGVSCYGVEPTASTAKAARAKGIEIVESFFGRDLARSLVEQGRSVDLTAANNVLAHVPDINDFVGGFATLLKPNGVSTFEFPHLLEMARNNQFDTAITSTIPISRSPPSRRSSPKMVFPSSTFRSCPRMAAASESLRSGEKAVHDPSNRPLRRSSLTKRRRV